MKLSRNDLLRCVQNVTTEDRTVLMETLESWLAQFPGDIEVEYHLAALHLEIGNRDAGLSALASVLKKHPKFKQAYPLMVKYAQAEEERQEYYQYIAFFQKKETGITGSNWSIHLNRIVEEMLKGEYSGIELEIVDLVQQNPDNALVALVHLLFTRSAKDDYATLQLAKVYQEKFPECLYLQLITAEKLFAFGADIGAMQLLREVAYRDHLGIVAKDLWGNEHAYKTIWAETDEFYKEFEENSGVQQILQKTKVGKKPEKGIASQEISRTVSPGSKSLFTKPVYVILTLKETISKKYGENTYAVIRSRIQELSDAIDLRENWSTFALIPDDENSMAQYGMTSIEKVDAWQIKLAIHDLSNYLQEREKRIGAVLIVGGDEIIPFHRLPNPTDDADTIVLSDNPYATDDNNYFVPEWSVGRFPDEKGSDPGLLLKQLREAINWHKQQSQKRTFLERVGQSLQFWNAFSDLYKEMSENKSNYGYSTAIWQRSSISAFRPIGKANFLRISPPYNQRNLDSISIAETEYAYFNLHGLDDSPNWYGQKDISADDDTPDFPVAISPSNIMNDTENPKVVLSEACYGAYVIDKSVDEALSLKFLNTGTRAFVGSTCIAYGSIYPPLIGADKFGYLFWDLIDKEYNAGDAFVRGKLNLMKSILRRQGYLDGEDQKTLLSFVLYGDPLFVHDSQAEDHFVIEDEKIKDVYQIVDDKELEAVAIPKFSTDILSNVKEVVKEYLPGIETAELKIREKKMKVMKYGASRKGGAGTQQQSSNRVFITYKKNFRINSKTIKQYTRVTLDDRGKLIKLSISK